MFDECKQVIETDETIYEINHLDKWIHKFDEMTCEKNSMR